MRFALIPSPFVGPSTWSLVAAALDRAQVVDYRGVAAPDWYDGAAERIVAQVDGEPWVAVLHSSAGPLAPSLAAFAEKLRGFIFVDAVLPHPNKSMIEIAPPQQVERLKGVTSPDGLLPRWDKWFPSAVFEAWVPDQRKREAISDDIPTVPFAFLQAIAPGHRDWERLPATFIKLTEGYEANAARAEERGWTVVRLKTNHLAMVSHPIQMADTLAALSD